MYPLVTSLWTMDHLPQASIIQTIDRLRVGRQLFPTPTPNISDYSFDLAVSGTKNIVIFPLASSERRFMLVIRGAPSSGLSGTLSLQVVVGKCVRNEWSITLSNSASARKYTGTLALFLSSLGLGPKNEAVGLARSSLKAKGSFSAYEFQSPALVNSYEYWFVHADGRYGDKSFGHANTNRNQILPNTKSAYELPEEEYIAMINAYAKKSHRRTRPQ